MSKRRVKSVATALGRTDHPIADSASRGSSFRAGVADGLQNVVAGLGTDRDKNFYSSYSNPVIPLAQNRIDLEAMFRGSWVAKRIVTTVADDMTREWVRLDWDGFEDDEASAKLISKTEVAFDIKGKVNSAIRWARLYGGCVLYVGIRGEEDPSLPLNIETIKKGSLRSLHVLDRWRIAATGRIDYDLDSPNFGMPLYYTVAESDQSVPNVHWTRIIRFNGQQLPYFLWRQNGMWDDSALQAPLSSVTNYDTATNGAASMIWEANVDIIKAAGLADSLAMAGGSTKVAQRFLAAGTMKSFNRMLLLDKDTEEYQQKTTQFGGLNDVINNFVVDLCGACDIPSTRLFGQSSKGLSATGEYDLRNYYDHVSARQQTNLRPQLERLYEILVRHALGKMPTDFQIEFEPLWQASDKERAEIDKLRADTDHIYITDGVLNEGMVARELQDRDTYRTLEDEDVNLAKELALQPDPVLPALGVVPTNGAVKPAVPPKAPPPATS
jgi:phage-related protein (TIGR01555 family)